MVTTLGSCTCDVTWIVLDDNLLQIKQINELPFSSRQTTILNPILMDKIDNFIYKSTTCVWFIIYV
ncbi:hypothetical protein A6J40_03165 [Legionella longbeachae]|uniref:Uncharacterized protein n=1 Tax=Legionella longbeachae serogroup 1 (strain NSW150) TaxID=661367 RepID=D3HSU6_LEGLN|nr:hypothetical protein A6J40_03165 [Legionella longbeachae]EEZ94875.1 hypothetical protein LLB_0025 [Legionella longbeachae D-4968]CBJ11986.1 protein of unknown function [Legionella longbeachae NSW150]ARM32325.1 hypothetical protein B0B39_01715 [Legionella longbeachae]QIN32328.1 hypothetical protein GCB94_09305 [Legionella longbeachae]